jgi:hypothetical protein
MEQIGSQVKLPLRRAMQIAVQGIRIRLGRSLVTISGVVLGIAFLMSNVTAQLIKDAIARERETRQTVTLMEAALRAEVGDCQGKTIAVAACGALAPAELGLLAKLAAAKPALVKGYGLNLAGLKQVELKDLGRDAHLLVVLGAGPQAPAALGELAAGLAQKVVLDSLAARAYPGAADPEVRRELFFSQATDEQLARLKQKAEQSKFRTLWIAIISILVTVIGISNALLMSVTERFREIGTMKCLGALSGFIRRLFLIESALIGCCGSVIGMLAGGLLPIVVFGFSFGFALVLGQLNYLFLAAAALGSVAVGTLLAMVAAIYPANFAARMVPATALRTNI